MTLASPWQWQVRPSARLPPLAWLAEVEASLVTVDCGASVALAEDGFFEGTWAGDAALSNAARATTVFGSGMVALGSELIVVTPSHPLEQVYVSRFEGRLVVANSLVALMVRTNLEPDPAVPYPAIFGQVANLKWLAQEGDPARLAGARLTIPMANGSVDAVFYENLIIRRDGTVELAPKPRERPFTSFADYRSRLIDRTASLVANAPAYAPVVALSAGYDSTAVAAVVAAVGGTHAVGFDRTRTMRNGRTTDDSGAPTAARLGMSFEQFDPRAYMARHDLPEAEFLATGMSGEDVFMSALEPVLSRKMLLTGHWGGRMWDLSVGEHVRIPHPGDVSGCSLGEFRLRSDFVHVPLPFFGAAHVSRGRSFVWDADMRPYHVGGGYDRPIARRLAEEAGIPRGSFARSKGAVGVLFQRDGRKLFSPTTLDAVDSFAAAEGRTLAFVHRTPIGRRHRALIKLGHTVGAGRVVRGIDRRRLEMTHFEPVGGALVFRWAVSVIRSRYQELAPESSSAGR